MRYIFLDIDGVLNRHEIDFNVYSQCSTIYPPAMARFNMLLTHFSDHGIVISSAWRYLLKNMSIQSFKYMLQTHGLWSGANIIGKTISDDWCEKYGQWGTQGLINGKLICSVCEKEHQRADQIGRYLTGDREKGCKYVILDSDDFGFTEKRMNFVHVDDEIGLSDENIKQAIDLLKGE